MRHQSLEYVQKFIDEHGPFNRVLDVGSMSIQGDSTIRGFFNKEYIGVDMREGPNVDVVLNAHNLTDKYKEEFDLVVCLDTLEHDDRFWLTIDQMKRVLKKGGWMIIGVPSRRTPFHEHPSDYWRFMGPAMDLFFEGFEFYTKVVEIEDHADGVENEIYGSGRKI